MYYREINKVRVHYPINCEISAGGYFVCEKVRSLYTNVRNAMYKLNVYAHRLRLWMYLRLTSSLRT